MSDYEFLYMILILTIHEPNELLELKINFTSHISFIFVYA